VPPVQDAVQPAVRDSCAGVAANATALRRALARELPPHLKQSNAPRAKKKKKGKALTKKKRTEHVCVATVGETNACLFQQNIRAPLTIS
jgi:hypothetical protein